MTGVPSQGSAKIESGVIKYDAPGSFEGITEIGYSITDEIGTTIFSGTVKIQKGTIQNGKDSVPGEPSSQTKTWKDYIWIPIIMFVLGVITIIWKKMNKTKNSVL